MSLFIKNVEMPTDHPLWIVVHSDGTVETNEVSESRPVGWQTLRNAAVPVPPHGRLIDADVLFDFILNIYKTAQGDARKAYRDVLDAIVAAGDVISAEEGE